MMNFRVYGRPRCRDPPQMTSNNFPISLLVSKENVMADGYKEGYGKGRQDKQARKSKDMRPPLKAAVLKGKRYTNTFVAGYKDGYRRGKS